PEKRQKYDQYGSAWNRARQTGAPPPGWEGIHFDFGNGGGGFDFGDIGGMGGGGSERFSSFFDMLFGGGGPGGRRGGAGAGFGGQGFGGQNFGGQSGGGSTEATLPLTVEEAVQGGTREITLSDPQTGQRRTFSVKIPAGV